MRAQLIRENRTAEIRSSDEGSARSSRQSVGKDKTRIPSTPIQRRIHRVVEREKTKKTLMVFSLCERTRV